MKRTIGKSYLFSIDNCKVYWVVGGGPNGIRNINGKNMFIGAGNDRAYEWIPKDEYWVEHYVSEQEGELVFNLLHEIMERTMMRDNKLEYQNAHTLANYFENELRQNYKFAGLNTNGFAGFSLALMELMDCSFNNDMESTFSAYFNMSMPQFLSSMLRSLRA